MATASQSSAQSAGVVSQRTVLTQKQVAEARRDVAAGATTVGECARRYGVRDRTMEQAVYGYTWRSLTDPAPLAPPPPADRPRPAARLTEQLVAQVRRDYESGASLSILAERAKVSTTTIRQAVHGHTWRHVTDPPPVPVADQGGATVLSEEDEQEICVRRARGESYRAIAAAVGAEVSVVWRADQRLRRD